MTTAYSEEDQTDRRRSLSPAARSPVKETKAPTTADPEPRAEEPPESTSTTTAEVLAENPGTNLFVTSLSYRTREAELKELFGKHGEVFSCKLLYDPQTRESRGFGFVTMATKASADSAIEALNGLELDGKTILVQLARRGRPRTPTPGRYHGTVKRGEPERGGERYRERRPYYGYDYRRDYDDRRGGYDDHHRSSRYDRYDDRPRYEDRDRGYSRDRDYDRPRGEYSHRDDFDRRRHDYRY